MRKQTAILLIVLAVVITIFAMEGCIFGSDDKKEKINTSLQESKGYFEGLPLSVIFKWSFYATSTTEYWGLWANGNYKATFSHDGTDNKTYKLKLQKVKFYDKNEMLIASHSNMLPGTLTIAPNTSVSVDKRFGIMIDSIKEANKITSALTSISLVE